MPEVLVLSRHCMASVVLPEPLPGRYVHVEPDGTHGGLGVLAWFGITRIFYEFRRYAIPIKQADEWRRWGEPSADGRHLIVPIYVHPTVCR